MTRINTNVSSLIARKNLARSNTDLQTALTRLSTGLRINVGKDDPAGLIASESLRSDIVATQQAINNSERANQVIATADSALGQISSLLNDIRSLVTEAANSGALSDAQIQANQLQVDSSLEAINRISQVTRFQGRRLLDGSLDFITTAGTVANIQDVKIDQANLGTTGAVAVDIDISSGATQALVTNSAIAATITPFASQTTLTFADGSSIDVVADATGTAGDGLIINFAETLSGAGTATAVLAGSTLTVTLDVTSGGGTTVTVADIVTAINGELTGHTATDNASGGAGYVEGSDAAGTLGTTAGGVDAGGGLADDVVVQIGGAVGTEVFNFEAGISIDQIAAAVNLLSDATGVQATNNAGTLDLQSTGYGSASFVSVNALSGTFTTNALRAEGNDIQATVNGVAANGRGNELSINTSTLDLSVTVSDGSDLDIDFNITDGGALFQLGPDVVSNQQARLGIQSVNSATLGGISGQLYELASGGRAGLEDNPTLAGSIISEAIGNVTQLRGRLGAFQRTTLDTNIASLNETLANLSDAESVIRDADFAAESARLTRAQILVQSGTAVLAIANQNPQNVLALLR